MVAALADAVFSSSSSSVVAVFLLLLIAVVVVVGCSGPLLPKIVKLLFKTVVRYYCRISCNICCIRVNSESCWCFVPRQVRRLILNVIASRWSGLGRTGVFLYQE